MMTKTEQPRRESIKIYISTKEKQRSQKEAELFNLNVSSLNRVYSLIGRAVVLRTSGLSPLKDLEKVSDAESISKTMSGFLFGFVTTSNLSDEEYQEIQLYLNKIKETRK